MLKNKGIARDVWQTCCHEEGQTAASAEGFRSGSPAYRIALKLKSFFVWTEVKLDINAPDKLVPQLAQGVQGCIRRW